LMQGRLPASVTARRKKGFGVPIGSWLRKPKRPLCEDTLSSVKIKASGTFDHAYVEKLKQEHFSGQADHRKKLWTLLVFMLWHDRWSAARPQPEQGWNLAAPRSERRA